MVTVQYTMILLSSVLRVGQSAESDCQNILQGIMNIADKNVDTMRKELVQGLKTIQTEFGDAMDTLRKDVKLKTHIIYTRWGRADCPKHADLLYAGYVAGSNYAYSGGSAESLCLPSENPVYYNANASSPGTFIWGAEYQTSHLSDNRKHLNNHEVPCAVCKRKGKSVVRMIPAMDSCPVGMTKEYSGVIMAGHYQHPSATQYTCMDSKPEKVVGGHRNDEGRLFYNLWTFCGSLKCPPYENKKELACVLCSL